MKMKFTILALMTLATTPAFAEAARPSHLEMNCRPQVNGKDGPGLPYTVTRDGEMAALIGDDGSVEPYSVTGREANSDSAQGMSYAEVQDEFNQRLYLGFDLDAHGDNDRSEVRWGETPSQTKRIAICTMDWSKTE